jgi:RNA polymerase sigma-70 factor (ECF subfamily)
VSDAPDPTAEGIAAENERAERLWRAIDDLPDKLREAIVLSAIQGFDVREVALLLGVPDGTVKSRLFLARKGLAQRLQCLVTDTGKR